MIIAEKRQGVLREMGYLVLKLMIQKYLRSGYFLNRFEQSEAYIYRFLSFKITIPHLQNPVCFLQDGSVVGYHQKG